MRDLVAFIDRLRADLAEAAAAIERGDVDGAMEKFDELAATIQMKVAELRSLSDGDPV